MGGSRRAADAADHRTIWHRETGSRQDAILMPTAVTDICEHSFAASALAATKFWATQGSLVHRTVSGDPRRQKERTKKSFAR
jgi:hypothetical protein